jgi:ribose transport system permease protein
MEVKNKSLFSYFFDNSATVIFALLFIVFSIMAPSFFSLSNLLNLLIQSSALVILAVGMSFVLLTGGIDLSVGAIMLLVGVVVGKLALAGLPLFVLILLCMGVGILYGVVHSILITRFNILPFIVTLATFYIGRGLGLYISETRALNLPESFLFIGSYKIAGIALPIYIMMIVVALAYYFLNYTQTGKHIYAVGYSQEKAIKAGINTKRIITITYILCGLCAALGGIVSLGQLGAVSPTFGLQAEFTAIAAAVLGGTSLFGGKGQVFPGTFMGALTIQCIQTGLVVINADPYIYPVVTGIVIFFIVLLDSLRHGKLAKKFNLQVT